MAEMSNRWPYVRRTFRYLLPYKQLVVMSGVLLMVGSGFALLSPWPLKILVDNVLGHRPLPWWIRVVLGPLAANQFSLLIVAVSAGLLLTIISNAMTVLDEYVNTTIHENVVLDFRSELFQHAQR